jgi:hypothetical protein
MHRRIPWLIAGLAMALSPALSARPPYVNLLPNGRVNACANCHVNPLGGGPRNPFGQAFGNQGRTTPAQLAAIDSDGDGFTNGQELQDPASGNALSPMLISSPGFPHSTPGERAIFLVGVLPSPTPEQGGQMVGLFNALEQPVDASGLLLFSGEQPWPLPQGTTIPPRGTLNVVIDGAPDEVRPSFLSEPAGGGLSPLAPQADFISLHWAGDPSMFDRPHLMLDYMQWGQAGQPLESAAVQGGQWQAGQFAPTPPPGSALRHDGGGEGASHWRVEAMGQ